jgi:hypothetical protein
MADDDDANGELCFSLGGSGGLYVAVSDEKAPNSTTKKKKTTTNNNSTSKRNCSDFQLVLPF